MAPDEGVEDVEGDPPVARKGGRVGIALGGRLRAVGRRGRNPGDRRRECGGQSKGGARVKPPAVHPLANRATSRPRVNSAILHAPVGDTKTSPACNPVETPVL